MIRAQYENVLTEAAKELNQRPLMADCQLAGLKVADLTGRPVALSTVMHGTDKFNPAPWA